MRRLVIVAVLVTAVVAGCGGGNKPTAPPSGSCCALNGTCTVTTQANCAGNWTAGGVCTPNGCTPPQPTGSCCAVDGTCTETTQANCTATWTEAGVCTPNPCPQPPTGGCVALDGTCTVTTLVECSGVWTEGGTCPPPSLYLPQSSPTNSLANLKMAYESRDIDQYKKLFSDDFAFVFSPADAIDPDDPTPVQWGREEEFTSSENMFVNELVERIDLDYLPAVPERADSVQWGPRAWKVKVDNANLQIHTRNEAGEPLIYLVPGTTEMFFFREEPSRPASDGRPGWFIFRWEDQPIGAVKTEDMTWGRIKAVFR